jgi:hypothetical protein
MRVDILKAGLDRVLRVLHVAHKGQCCAGAILTGCEWPPNRCDAVIETCSHPKPLVSCPVSRPAKWLPSRARTGRPLCDSVKTFGHPSEAEFTVSPSDAYRLSVLLDSGHHRCTYLHEMTSGFDADATDSPGIRFLGLPNAGVGLRSRRGESSQARRGHGGRPRAKASRRRRPNPTPSAVQFHRPGVAHHERAGCVRAGLRHADRGRAGLPAHRGVDGHRSRQRQTATAHNYPTAIGARKKF